MQVVCNVKVNAQLARIRLQIVSYVQQIEILHQIVIVVMGMLKMI